MLCSADFHFAAEGRSATDMIQKLQHVSGAVRGMVSLYICCIMQSVGTRQTSSHHSSFMGIVCQLRGLLNGREDLGNPIPLYIPVAEVWSR